MEKDSQKILLNGLKVKGVVLIRGKSQEKIKSAACLLISLKHLINLDTLSEKTFSKGSRESVPENIQRNMTWKSSRSFCTSLSKAEIRS